MGRRRTGGAQTGERAGARGSREGRGYPPRRFQEVPARRTRGSLRSKFFQSSSTTALLRSTTCPPPSSPSSARTNPSSKPSPRSSPKPSSWRVKSVSGARPGLKKPIINAHTSSPKLFAPCFSVSRLRPSLATRRRLSGARRSGNRLDVPCLSNSLEYPFLLVGMRRDFSRGMWLGNSLPLTRAHGRRRGGAKNGNTTRCVRKSVASNTIFLQDGEDEGNVEPKVLEKACFRSGAARRQLILGRFLTRMGGGRRQGAAALNVDTQS